MARVVKVVFGRDHINDETEEENSTSKEPKKKVSDSFLCSWKTEKVEKTRDNDILQIMQEDVALKKSMTADESNTNADAKAMTKIPDSTQMLSHAIMAGFNYLVEDNQSNKQPFPQQYPVQGNFNQALPFNINAGFSYGQSSYGGGPLTSTILSPVHGPDQKSIH